MREEWREAVAGSTEIRGSLPPDGEEIFPNDFEIVVRALWPRKTAHELAAIAGKSDRAAKEWIRGTVEPPNVIIAAIVCRVTKRRR